MIAVQIEFKTRAAEIENYFRFLLPFAEGEVAFKKVSSGENAMAQEDCETLAKTLKATGFLLLYNLVESTMKNAIEAIFDELSASGVNFDACRAEMRKVVIRNLKKYSPHDIHTQLSPIAIRLLTRTFHKEKLFNGNVDAQMIRETVDDYGIARKWRVKGEKLFLVKHNRNQLAHGNKSFAEVGRDYSAPELLKTKNEVIAFLEEVLESVGQYISKKQFLDCSLAVSAVSTGLGTSFSLDEPLNQKTP